jgi:hypothetical protein
VQNGGEACIQLEQQQYQGKRYGGAQTPRLSAAHLFQIRIVLGTLGLGIDFTSKTVEVGVVGPASVAASACLDAHHHYFQWAIDHLDQRTIPGRKFANIKGASSMKAFEVIEFKGILLMKQVQEVGESRNKLAMLLGTFVLSKTFFLLGLPPSNSQYEDLGIG